jgi:hypothetical protein
VKNMNGMQSKLRMIGFLLNQLGEQVIPLIKKHLLKNLIHIIFLLHLKNLLEGTFLLTQNGSFYLKQKKLVNKHLWLLLP